MADEKYTLFDSNTQGTYSELKAMYLGGKIDIREDILTLQEIARKQGDSHMVTLTKIDLNYELLLDEYHKTGRGDPNLLLQAARLRGDDATELELSRVIGSQSKVAQNIREVGRFEFMKD